MGREALNGSPDVGHGASLASGLSLAVLVQIGKRLQISPQQVLIVRMIREEDLDNEAIGMRLRAMMKPGRAKAKPQTPDQERRTARKNVETQLDRMFEKLNRPAIRGDGPEVRSRTALIDRIWVEYWRLREEQRAAVQSHKSDFAGQ